MYYIKQMQERHSRGVPYIVTHLFTTLGNGVELDNKGCIRGSYHIEVIDLGKPEPLSSVYPWTTNESLQPFRKLAGCSSPGFREAAEYFISCVELTPETVKGISEWKENLGIVREVLLGTPTITDTYSIDSMDEFLAKVEEEKDSLGKMSNTNRTENPPPSVKKVWMFDVQWSDCPKMVEEEVIHSWRDYELGNDRYFWKATVDENLFEEYPNIYFWLVHKGVPQDEEVLVHWWW